MKIFFRNASGLGSTSSSARMALVNWYCDEVTEGKDDSIIYVADNPSSFLQQIMAAVERRSGKSPCIDQSVSLEDQFLYILKFLHRYGGISKLVIL